MAQSLQERLQAHAALLESLNKAVDPPRPAYKSSRYEQLAAELDYWQSRASAIQGLLRKVGGELNQLAEALIDAPLDSIPALAVEERRLMDLVDLYKRIYATLDHKNQFLFQEIRNLAPSERVMGDRQKRYLALSRKKADLQFALDQLDAVIQGPHSWDLTPEEKRKIVQSGEERNKRAAELAAVEAELKRDYAIEEDQSRINAAINKDLNKVKED